MALSFFLLRKFLLIIYSESAKSFKAGKNVLFLFLAGSELDRNMSKTNYRGGGAYPKRPINKRHRRDSKDAGAVWKETDCGHPCFIVSSGCLTRRVLSGSQKAINRLNLDLWSQYLCYYGKFHPAGRFALSNSLAEKGENLSVFLVSLGLKIFVVRP